MSIVSNIKNLFALTAVLCLLTACGGGASSSDANTNGGSSAASSGTAAITSISRPTSIPESTLTPELTPTSIPEPTSTPKPTPVPDGAAVVTGLRAGEQFAQSNSVVLNNALKGGDKNLIIPEGTWYTDDTVVVYENTTLSFRGKLEQINPSTNPKSYYVVKIDAPNVVLNNPHISQGGGNRTEKPGTHAVLAIYGTYNTGNITINGGLLEGGGSNCFHGGRNDTVFNGTTFRDSREHLVYGYGIKGDGNADGNADGLIFNNCIFERPGIGNDEHESNHIQIRNYKNVEVNNCIISGKPENGHTQYAFLMTDVDGAVINDTSIKDYKGGVIYTGNNTKNVVFNRIQAWNASGSFGWIRRTIGSLHLATFNDSVFHGSTTSFGITAFNDCTFDLGNKEFVAEQNSDLTFDNCTWE